MSLPVRLLGFAFTNADFLFEMDTAGTILFAAGAANDLVKESGDTLIGKPAGKLFKPSEGTKFATFAKALKSGDRAGPFKLTLATGVDANLAMLRLPDNGSNISCTLARPGTRAPSAATDPKTGLPSREGFMAAAEKAGDRDALTLVHVPGLPELCAQLPPEGADALLQRIGDSIQTAGASVAARLSDSSFGAVAPATSGALNIASKVSDAITAGGLTPPKIAETRLGLQGTGLTPEQRLLSMRYVIDRFAEKGKLDADNGDIAGVFAAMLEETQRRLTAMTRTVGEGDFEIAYQPICDLATGKACHYEALARFSNPEGTQATVAFIEALGIANAFDLAVASKVLSLVEQQSGTHIAFNVSGATIASPSSFGMLAAILAKGRKFASCLLIEVTETAAITDLENAGKAIGALRAMGYRVGLDDFGAGAASINYLHAFQVDFVKFDGAMIKKIGSSKRDDALLAGLAKLCGEMGITTIAEWIEDEAMAKCVREMGFHQGQGKWLGAPSKAFPAQPVAVGKRKGVTESWG
ncbi:MAG: GGDEF domain-containing protein [Burkholderia sp.]|nr:GGDEF domain-containing protein [Burkholderia sp.]